MDVDRPGPHGGGGGGAAAAAGAALAAGGMFQVHSTPSTVLCCLCGASMHANATGMCVACIRTNIDITEGLQKHLTVLFCPDCSRYLSPPRAWVKAELESKELLAFCLKRMKNLNKVKLVDAGFIWTEPHSKRLKLKLTVQKEVMASAILQQSFVVEYVVEDHMCDSCNRHNANPDQWVAAVQVRQKAEHKRTFLFLEQLILKHSAADAAINIRKQHDGVDFFFASRSHALKFVDFVGAVVPTQHRSDKQLVSHDIHTSAYNYKHTFSVEICPVCKDDLVCLPPKAASAMGNLGPLVLCVRVSNTIALMDPRTLRVAYLDAGQYWRYAFRPLLSARQLVEYVVLDVEPVHGAEASFSMPSTPMSGASSASFNPFAPAGGRGGGSRGAAAKFVLADVQVARVADFGKNDTIFHVRTHLGHLLRPGDYALGYDLYGANLNSDDVDKYKSLALPETVLVRKSYEEKRKKKRGRARPWKLRQLDMEVEGAEGGGQGKGGAAERDAAERELMERERFMDEVEEDPDLRSRIAVYQNPDYIPPHADGESMGDDGEDGDEPPEIPLEELLADLNIEDGVGREGEDGGDDDEDDHMDT